MKLEIRNSFLALLFSFTLALPASAAIPNTFTPQVPLPNINITATELNDGSALGKYVKGLYQFAFSIVGILATIIIMYGGLLHIVAAGDSGKEKDAREWITAAISGLLLLFSTYVILSFVNPDLVRFRNIKIDPINSGTPPVDATNNSVSLTGDPIIPNQVWHAHIMNYAGNETISDATFQTESDCEATIFTDNGSHCVRDQGNPYTDAEIKCRYTETTYIARTSCSGSWISDITSSQVDDSRCGGVPAGNVCCENRKNTTRTMSHNECTALGGTRVSR